MKQEAVSWFRVLAMLQIQNQYNYCNVDKKGHKLGKVDCKNMDRKNKPQLEMPVPVLDLHTIYYALI